MGSTLGRTTATAEIQLLSARLRAGDKRAIQRVVSELTRRNGNIEATAKALGISRRTLYAWRDAVPALGEAIAAVARGRAGRPRKREA